MEKSDIRFWRYSIPNDAPGEGWAIVLMDSTGMFAVVSDFGNYVFKWTYHGMDDFRKFMIDVEPGYFCSKMGTRKHLDAERTVRDIKDTILRRRREGYWTKLVARQEWNRIRNKDFNDREDQDQWYDNSLLGGDPEVFRYDYEPELKQFSERVLPRIQAAIRAELEQEAGHVPAV